MHIFNGLFIAIHNDLVDGSLDWFSSVRAPTYLCHQYMQSANCQFRDYVFVLFWQRLL